MPNSRLSAFFSLLLVFCSGAVVGVFGYRAYTHSESSPARPPEKKQDPEELRKALIAEMTREVHLDDQQVAKLRQIYDDTRERFNEISKKRNDEARAAWEEQTARIKALLRPDQEPLYEALRARKDAERKAHRKGGPPGQKKD
jgi:hypothetical protein